MANKSGRFASMAIAAGIAACTPPQASGLQNDAIASGRYHSQPNSDAIVSRERGALTISFLAGGDPDDGVAVGADCEMVARYDREHHRWLLAPFSTERTTVTQEDVARFAVEIVPLSDRAFDVYSDYDSKRCAMRVRISGRYSKSTPAHSFGGRA